jgi:hypothetical protein
MNLPVYHHIKLKSAAFEELSALLFPEINQKQPVVFNLLSFNLDEQREIIGVIENYFATNELSYKFPYPVYVLTVHESTISGLPLAKKPEELPKFFLQKEGKMNVKETQLLNRNKLLQQEVRNADAGASEEEIQHYGHIHRKIQEYEEERLFYKSVLHKLIKERANG